MKNYFGSFIFGGLFVFGITIQDSSAVNAFWAGVSAGSFCVLAHMVIRHRN